MADVTSKKTEKTEMTNKELAVIDPLYEKYVKSVIRTLGSTNFYKFFMDSISHADNEFQFSNRRLEKFVDTSWVEAIEEALEGFQNVIAAPRNVIKEEEIIVNVANAKKAGSDVVRHLATHAALVDNFDEDRSEVQPGRLMQKLREDTMGIYENRLVFTTLEKAFHFVKIRHDALFEVMSDEFGAKLKVRSDMVSATESVHLDMFLHITDSDSVLQMDEKNRDIFDRISRLYRILSVHMNSQFAAHMARRPRISGAVTKTNILKRDPNYRAIVKLWEFLGKYEDVGYTIRVVEQNPVIGENFERDIYHNILFNYLVLKGHLERDKDRMLPEPLKEKKKALKPKFIKEIIEEFTEDYDLPDIEIRKVLIEELTKEQLMLEEEAERHRLVEEQERRRLEEAERQRLEEEAEKERLRIEKEAEEERIRKEKEAEEARLLVERMEREQEFRRRGKLFRQELDRFFDRLEDRLIQRAENTMCAEEKEDFEDAAYIMEETERLKNEELQRERQRKLEEAERQKHEALMEKQRIERERQEQLIKEETERLERIRQEQYEKDLKKVIGLKRDLYLFNSNIEARLKQREEVRLAEKAAKEESERIRERRLEERKPKQRSILEIFK